MKLAYITNARIPSERANAVQSVQMCAAFAEIGLEVTLFYPHRHLDDEFREADLWDYYGVPRAFARQLVWCVDWFRFTGGRMWLERIVFFTQSISFAIGLMWALARKPAHLYYSRDPFVIALMLVLMPHARNRIFFEAHNMPLSSPGRRLRRWTLNRIGGAATISDSLKRLHEELGVSPAALMVAPDGVTLVRFHPDMPKAQARASVRLPLEPKLVMYVGGLYAGRGLEELLSAVKDLPVILVIVGGDRTDIGQFQRLAARQQVTNVRFEGRKPPTRIGLYLAAADVLAMPYSRRTVAPGGITTDYMSPLKMFEYMAAGRPIVASNLPVLREVLNERNAMLVEPDDARSLRDGLARLLADESLASRLALQARRDVETYSWARRANAILEFARSRMTRR